MSWQPRPPSAGRRLDSAAPIADGHHARVDGYVSLGVTKSPAVVAIGFGARTNRSNSPSLR